MVAKIWTWRVSVVIVVRQWGGHQGGMEGVVKSVWMDGWMDAKIGFAPLPRASTTTDVKGCLRGAALPADQPDTGRILRPGLSGSQGWGLRVGCQGWQGPPNSCGKVCGHV